MTERKFTPPTEFPAEYVNGYGDKITLLVRGKGEYPLIGQGENGCVSTYTEEGAFNILGDDSIYDLHDLPQKQVHWSNDYNICGRQSWWKSRESADENALNNRIAVIRREWVEGELPQYFAEETFDE